MTDQKIRDSMRGGSDADKTLWNSICDQMESEKWAWIAMLRARGVKISHPNDGWVNRDKQQVTFCYPQFDDGVSVGDLAALGDPQSATKIVRITERVQSNFFSNVAYWQYEEVETLPKPQRKP